MSRKTVAMQQKMAQVKRVGGDVSALFPQGRALGKGVRGGWELGNTGYKHTFARNRGTVCTLPMKPEKQARLARLAR